MPIQLKPVTFEALDDLKRFLPVQGTGDCNLSVASLIARAQERETHYAIVNDTLVMECQLREAELIMEKDCPKLSSKTFFLWELNLALLPQSIFSFKDLYWLMCVMHWGFQHLI